MFVLTPVIWIVNKLADAIFFILRIDKNNTGAKITEDELRTVVNVSEEEGVIEDEEKEMITTKMNGMMQHRLNAARMTFIRASVPALTELRRWFFCFIRLHLLRTGYCRSRFS